MLKNILISKWRRLSIVSIVLAIAIGISSCRALLQSSSAQTNNQLVYGILSDPKTFNPALSNESPNIFGYVGEGLITENGKGEIEPALAESWVISPDKKTVTFTLKKNLKWSDGAPLTIDDVAFTFNEVFFNEDIPTDTRDILKIGKDRKLPTVKKVDNDRIELTTPDPSAPFLRTTGISILPAHKLRPTVVQKDKSGKPLFLSTWGLNTKPADLVSNGMYMVDTYTPGERIVFKKNPYYWRKDSKGQQQPYIDRVVWQIVESTDTELVQFRSGGLDSFKVLPDFFSLLKKEEQKGGYKIYNGGPATGTTFVSFNLNEGERDGKPLVDPIKSRWFNNVKFRQAIAYGINRQRMINNIYRGLGAPQDSPISVPSPYYLSREQGLPFYDYNPKKAKELFTAAGFKYNEQNKLVDDRDNPVRFTLITNSGNKIREALGTQIKQDLALVGVEVDFTPIAFSLLIDRIDNSLQWDSLLIGFTGGIEPNDGANFWSVDGGSHIFNLKPQKGKPQLTDRRVADWEKKIDELYIQAAQELDEGKRRQIYIETQKITQENLPCIYLVNPLSLSAVKNRVQGIDYSPIGGPFWNLYELKISDRR
ncbi:ABC transporter substrate-binding protein [Chamaesiphon polymorphus]|uniref:Peptide ABC transporter substrate-binding protein n=1 Tax=Chamaesiphon polymorphus CCALA 037 TaxID=2107692 RepID=A0A2T1FVF6_9CYAN|nr:ABC transporter substrate-binding protein [Chamaesiphon polymorphus]PSB48973.1 peptide ABC transporter substrate-binding protein [Chamaesiphon polymorphus CCALA 037]